MTFHCAEHGEVSKYLTAGRWRCRTCKRAKDRLYYRTPTGWAKTILSVAARRAPVSITAEELIALVPTHCPVFGIELIVGEARTASDNSPSVDRIDPSKGYAPGNIIIVSNLVNRIKSNATPDQILAVGNFYRNLSTTGNIQTPKM